MVSIYFAAMYPVARYLYNFRRNSTLIVILLLFIAHFRFTNQVNINDDDKFSRYQIHLENCGDICDYIKIICPNLPQWEHHQLEETDTEALQFYDETTYIKSICLLAMKEIASAKGV